MELAFGAGVAVEDESFVFERWVKQGVLMLNSALTVFEGQSNSHSKYWQPVTDYIIKEISNQTNGVVFILWGNFAKTKINKKVKIYINTSM